MRQLDEVSFIGFKRQPDGECIISHEVWYTKDKDMKFTRESFQIGGKMVVPHSFVSKTEAGEIIGLTGLGVNLAYYKGTSKQQVVFYSYGFLNNYYANDELNDRIPF